jgi:hypothetical protein
VGKTGYITLAACAVICACGAPAALSAAQKGGSGAGDVIAAAAANIEKVSKDLYDGNLRLADMGLNIVEKDLRLIGKNLPLEKIYGLLTQADDSIKRNTPARAKMSLEGALNETNRLKGVSGDTVASLRESLSSGSAALGEGSIDAAKKSIAAANDALDKTGVRANYKKAQSHFAKARANVLEGSAEGAQSEVSLMKESLADLKGNVEASQVRSSIANAAAFVRKGAVVPAQREISQAVAGLSRVSAAAGESGQGALTKAVEDLKRVSAGLSVGASQANAGASNSLNEILLSIEEFLE